MKPSLRNIRLFQGLSSDERKAVSACLKEKAFDKGETITRASEPCNRVFIVCKGRVKVYRMSPAGREQILEVLGPGDTCACNPGMSDWMCSSSAEAMEPSSVWFLNRGHYVKLLESQPEMAKSLNRILADRVKCMSALIEEVSLKDSKKRLVRFLLDMQKMSGPLKKGEEAALIPFTREEIAQRLGTARETIARNLSQLQSQKLIDIQPHKIVLKDRQGLIQLLS